MAMGIERQAEGYLVVDEINLRESYLRDILSLRAHFDGLCEEFGVGVVAAARRADGNGCGHRQATRNNQRQQIIGHRLDSAENIVILILSSFLKSHRSSI
jgi:hypothetical protein